MVDLLASTSAAPQFDDASDPANDAAFLWNGFNHTWDYNHRAARLGDGIVHQSADGTSCQATLRHTAASGLGPDSAAFTSNFTQISASHLRFASVEVPLRLTGAEGATLFAWSRVDLPTGAHPESSLAVLNGFDMLALGSADKLKSLDLAVGPTRIASDGTLSCAAGVRLNAGCDSLECPPLDQTVDMDVFLEVLFIYTDDSTALATSTKRVSTALTWDKRTEIFPTTVADSITGQGQGSFPAAALALRSLHLSFDSWHHMLEWQTWVTPTAYDANSGQLQFSRTLFFKQWAQGMRWTHLPESLLAQRKSGSGTVGANLVLIQLAEGAAEAQTRAGTIDWPGYNLPPDDPAAVSAEQASFTY